MQKNHEEPHGLRLMVWGMILFVMMFAMALLLDHRGGEASFSDAVLVRAGELL